MTELTNLLCKINRSEFKSEIINNIRCEEFQLRKNKMYSIQRFKKHTIGNKELWYIECTQSKDKKELIYIKNIRLDLRKSLFDQISEIFNKSILPEVEIQNNIDQMFEKVLKYDIGNINRNNLLLDIVDLLNDKSDGYKSTTNYIRSKMQTVDFRQEMVELCKNVIVISFYRNDNNNTYPYSCINIPIDSNFDKENKWFEDNLQEIKLFKAKDGDSEKTWSIGIKSGYDTRIDSDVVNKIKSHFGIEV